MNTGRIEDMNGTERKRFDKALKDLASLGYQASFFDRKSGMFTCSGFLHWQGGRGEEYLSTSAKGLLLRLMKVRIRQTENMGESWQAHSLMLVDIHDRLAECRLG